MQAARYAYRGSRAAIDGLKIGEMFRLAVRLNAHALIVLHTHPSGDVTPSGADQQMTRRTVEAGRLLDVEVLDHVVLGAGQHAGIRHTHPDIWQ